MCLDHNVGGSGGFATGIQTAINRGADWVWLMDDDAQPRSDALEQLMAVADKPDTVYGSLAVSGDDTAWPTPLLDSSAGANRVNDVPDVARVAFVPFLGFMIHRDLIQRIGLPDAGFFILGDDFEYCQRARQQGSDIVVVGRSRIDHPKAQRHPIRVPGRTITYLTLPPWKRYYDIRNRLLIAYQYFGVLSLLTQTIPGSFVRLWGALRYEKRKLAQLHAWAAGMIDGLLRRKGKRHPQWRIH